MTFVYFAHPIDQSGQFGGASNAVADIRQTLALCGVSMYNPGRAFTLSHPGWPEFDRVDAINQAALDVAEALIAWLPSGVATLGVPTEIEIALRQEKPTLILTDNNLIDTSVQLAAWRNKGAETLPWSDLLARTWEADPSILINLLTWAEPEPLSWAGEANPPALYRPLQVQLDSAAKTPARHYDDDAGLDLAINVETRLDPGEYKLIPTGVRGALPDGTWGLIIGRSSSWHKHRLDIKLGVIDAGYRGELMIGVQNMQADSIVLEAGTRLAQYVIMPTFPGQVEVVSELPPAHRGENGYGSSGK